ncbi:MAG: CoA ester lyase [Gammaproteobacteria bacterium]|nr:CoA ester lyase [Gammaproteobacteria bacterium]
MENQHATRPRRSVLYVPGSNARALDKAPTLPADALILDLEDAVLPAAKTAARQAVGRAVEAGASGNREIIVRINGLGTPWVNDDIQAMARSGAHAVLLPKVDQAADVVQLDERLARAGAPPGLAIWVMAETPRGLLDLPAIARASPRVAVIVMGTADLGKALRIPDAGHRSGLVTVMAGAVLAARAAGLDILDGVYTQLTDPAGLRPDCELGRSLGFDGKTLIHPAQIGIANEIFGVPETEAVAAAALVSAWEAAAGRGAGVAVVDGRMVERLHVDEAERRLALYRAIRALQP